MKKLFTSLLGALALCAGSMLSSQAQTYQLVWADEFNGSIGNGWQFETGGGGWGNNEKQYYQAANATVNSTDLLITARKQSVGGLPYTSARLKTQGLRQFTYGKVEARIKTPLGQGLWPAFWMLGANIGQVGWPACGEIDIMEQVNADSRIYGTVHWDNNGHAEYGGNTPVAANVYHVYTVEWDASYIRWFVDGTKYHEILIANNAGGTEEFQRPFFLLLNLAVAGNWPGQAVDESKLPATMFVDYVRVYQKTSTPPPFSITLQAEAANVNNGMTVENCTDTGGGQNMGYVDPGDYLVWNNVTFPTSGSYTIEYRVASGASGGTISSDLNAGSIPFGNTGIPATGGWQNWTTVTKTVNVNAGTYNFGVFAQTGGWNLNYVRISRNTSARAATAPTSGLAASAAEGSEAQPVRPARSVEIYPNPVQDRLTLNADGDLRGAQYRILNSYGKVLASGPLSGEPLNTAALPAGIYSLQVTTNENRTITRRFVK